MQNLSEVENTALGASAAFVEAILLQPTIYWKNAVQQGLPWTVNPRVIYRGMGAALTNEMGQMGLQFGATGFLKNLIPNANTDTPSAATEMACAVGGGMLVAPFATFIECTMIQQQRHGGSMPGTIQRVARDYGLRGIFRGFVPVLVRDGMYVGGLLGVTPILQRYLMDEYEMSSLSSGMWASLAGGVFAGVVTTPFDALSTCMKGDMERKVYGGLVDTVKKRAAGGIGMLYAGLFWRTVNIAGTIYLANEARVRLSPIMFPDKF